MVYLEQVFDRFTNIFKTFVKNEYEFMNIRSFFFCLILISAFIFTNCVTQRASTIEGFDYDESKNQTKYFVSPYGSISIPGKWNKSDYNSVSGQQFFMNSDSIRIAIAYNRYDKYEFNLDGSKKGFDFIQAFYEWDSKYFVDSYGLNRKIIENDGMNNYILYQVFGEKNGVVFDTYFLIGEKNGNVSNLSLMITDKWTEDTKIKFLKGLYVKDE
jgi:hypothetical protein